MKCISCQKYLKNIASFDTTLYNKHFVCNCESSFTIYYQDNKIIFYRIKITNYVIEGAHHSGHNFSKYYCIRKYDNSGESSFLEPKEISIKGFKDLLNRIKKLSKFQ